MPRAGAFVPAAFAAPPCARGFAALRAPPFGAAADTFGAFSVKNELRTDAEMKELAEKI